MLNDETTVTADVTAYLQARFAEENAQVREALALAGPGRGGMCVATHRFQGKPGFGLVGVMPWDPRRAVAEIEAKHRVLEHLMEHYDPDDCWVGHGVIRLMLQPYADRPDFAPEWNADGA